MVKKERIEQLKQGLSAAFITSMSEVSTASAPIFLSEDFKENIFPTP